MCACIHIDAEVSLDRWVAASFVLRESENGRRRTIMKQPWTQCAGRAYEVHGVRLGARIMLGDVLQKALFSRRVTIRKLAPTSHNSALMRARRSARSVPGRTATARELCSTVFPKKPCFLGVLPFANSLKPHIIRYRCVRAARPAVCRE